MVRTGIRYKGTTPTYAFKRNVGKNHFIDIEDLFRLFGKAGGYSRITTNFVEWIYNTRIKDNRLFALEVEQSEFDDFGNYLSGLTEPELNRRKAEERSLKSSQVTVRSEKQKQEKVTLISSELKISESVESAESNLIESSKKTANARKTRATIIENLPSKPMKIDDSHVIRGDDFKRNSSENATSIVLDGGKPVGVESVNENFKFATPSKSERVFVADPKAAGDRDVASRPIVNYGGNSTKPVEDKDEKSSKVKGEKVGDNLMKQPARASVDNLRKPVTVDQIVRNKSESKAMQCIDKCRDTQVLRIAEKQLRDLGNKPRVESAVKRRLALLPAGSMR